MVRYGSNFDVLAAVKQNGWALEHASPALRKDPEVVLAAVSDSGRALEYASNKLRNNREFVRTALARPRLCSTLSVNVRM